MFSRKGSGYVLTFGELLLRLCPDTDSKWLNGGSLPVNVGGAELNVATALALWGIQTRYFTALPDNIIAQQLIQYLNNLNIDTSVINRSGNRVGLYYLASGWDMKHDTVIHDRARSSFASLVPGTVDWYSVLKGVTWFHLSAICPALTLQTAELCEEVLQVASSKGITISIDLNYRAKLWKYGVDPVKVMPRLAKYCNLIMGNIWAAKTLLGIPAGSVIESGDKSAYLMQAQRTSEQIIKKYPACSTVANTFRFDDGKGIRYYAAVYADGHLAQSAEYSSDHVIDKVGSGDCFMAGLIYGFYKQLSPQETLDFAAAAAFDKIFIPGDTTTSTVEKIKQGIKHEI